MFDKDEPTYKIFKFASLCGSKSNFKKDTPDDFTALIQARNAWTKSNSRATKSEVSEKVSQLKKELQPEYEKFYNANIDERLTDGDASEAGILKFFERNECIDIVKNQYPQVRVNNEDIKIPFNSTIKCMGN